MSDALYPVRLRWDRHIGIGVARCDGVHVELRWPPAIAGLEGAAEIDYIPHVICSVRIGCGAVRDMSEAEQGRALALLRAMSVQARDVIAGTMTAVVVVER